MNKIDEILHYWFDHPSDAARNKLWWDKNTIVDIYITKMFGDDLGKAIKGEYDVWADTAEGRLALIILLDQFSRQIFRDDPRAFAQDQKALQLAVNGVELGQDSKLEDIQRLFFYMPFTHSESKQVQQRNIELFGALADANPSFNTQLDFALRHKAIIDQFGRYPHRNIILGRQSTDNEVEFLKQPNSSF